MHRYPSFALLLCILGCSDPSSSADDTKGDAATNDSGTKPGKDGSVEASDSGDPPLTDGATDGQPPLTGGPPLSWDDPRFANVTESGPVSIPDGDSLVDWSIQEFSGNASIHCEGACTLTRVRVDSREALRIIEKTILIEDSFLEATGEGDDHADTIQAYSPDSSGSLILKNTTIVAHDNSATAGIFIADAWRPDLIDLENVVIWGGPFGVRFHADGYDNAHLRMKNVCFVGPFGYGRMIIDGGVGGNSSTGWTIDEWTNVNDCTIENGQLVVGAPIPEPT